MPRQQPGQTAVEREQPRAQHRRTRQRRQAPGQRTPRAQRVGRAGLVEHLCGGTVDRGAVDALPPARVGAEQGPVAQHVDAARNAARQFMNAHPCFAVERAGAAQPTDRQAVPDVAARFNLGQGFEVKARDDALRELFQLGPCEHGAQLGLADQDDLQQLALVRFQVGEQAKLLEHVDRQALRLVDDEHVVLPDRMGAQQELIERVEIVLDRAGAGFALRQLDVKLVADRLQQLGDGQLGVEDVGDVAVLRDLLQEAAAHRGLARADFAGEQHEPTPATQAIQQMGERLPVALAHEKVARVGRDRERLALQAEEFGVHGAKGTTPAATGRRPGVTRDGKRPGGGRSFRR